MQLNNLLCVLSRIQAMCIGEIAMGVRLDAEYIGSEISKVTGLDAEKLAAHCKKKTDSEIAAAALGCDEYDLEFYSWPQAFGSTSPFSGRPSGQMVTAHQVEAYVYGDKAAVFCGGKLIKTIGDFDFRTTGMV